MDLNTVVSEDDWVRKLPSMISGPKPLGDAVVTVHHLSKSEIIIHSFSLSLHHTFISNDPVRLTIPTPPGYRIAGRDDSVKALHDIHLAPDSEFYPIRRCDGFPPLFFFFLLERDCEGRGECILMVVVHLLPQGRVCDAAWTIGWRQDHPPQHPWHH